MNERRQHRLLKSRIEFSHRMKISLDEFKSIALCASDAPFDEAVNRHEEEEHEEGRQSGVDLVVVEVDGEDALSRVISQTSPHRLTAECRSLLHLGSV